MIDERFWTHRYKSLSYAAMAGVMVLGFFLFRGLLRGEGLHRDLMTILVAMLITKFGAMTWFHFKD
ncbi:MAG TPA: hypothetical protein VJ505_15720 [Holophagaceae bacterium]|nr:hypothetical protein [Holophagaceae bacterium]